MRQPQAGQEGKRREMQPLPGSPRLQAREPRIITRVAGFGEAFCLPCFRRRKMPLSGRENSLLFECNGPLAQPADDCLNCCETGDGGAAACLERRARSVDCTLAAEAAAVAATAAAQDQDPDQIKSAAATAAATTSAVVMFKTSTIAAATAAAQDQDQEDHIAPVSSVSTPASTITTAVCCRYITHY